MKRAYMLVHELDVNKGGMTTAMLTRSKAFYNHHIKGDIVTFDYKQNYPEILKTLVKEGRMDARTKMYNPFRHFRHQSNQKLRRPNKRLIHNLKASLKHTVEIKASDTQSRFFDIQTGEYVAYRRQRQFDSFYDLFHNNKRYQRMYVKNKNVHKVDVFNEKNKRIAERFFDRKGYLYLYRQVDGDKIGKVYLINEQKQFKNNVEFCAYYLNQLIKDKENRLMICDGPGNFPKMLSTHHRKVKKTVVLHANHYEKIDGKDTLKSEMAYILDRASRIDRIITLTEAQSRDIQEEFHINNVTPISNFVNIPRLPNEMHYPKVVGFISRLVEGKGVPYIIDIAKEVQKRDSEIEFHIYGKGPKEKPLLEAIEEHQLQDMIQVHGYTNDVSSKLNNFGCFLSTSQNEGQGLSMIEAMLHQRPVLAFNVKYGPKDLIKDGVNGYLIDNLDMQTMAQRIVTLLNDATLTRDMGKKARKMMIERYQTSHLIEQWKKTFEREVIND
ncbi:glycosyltransferase [Staphylococcus pettenkoferi]|uniref:Glycosyltransferase n=1 Tax=Staphylococcus pettenkoferi TaxID=170573 RepID=A0A9Q4H0G6_9STAP|nr:glycosyltransferase [Staphylococcus pettenkoferi]MCY1569364.1 glycosyltransferase [Staphylococcus pettenkoferi]MCY1575804.1 glycosyltransferase [Staphylococcus pettenkoferi]MCY1595705.1 glycosyltransferase [Staphylococcus pettenkoferi]MCY1617295.1 glycosyltransferase [Staphylococcus pettenkoferi]